MKPALLFLLTLLALPLFASDPEVTIPERDIALIKTVDLVEVTGTNDRGGAEDFSIHNAKALSQFIAFLIDARYVAVPKSLKPDFKSLSAYHVRLSSHGAPVLELNVIADSVLDLPDAPDYYMQAERHSDNIMAPLLRLR